MPTTVTEQMTMKDALSKVTIESEDWLDGDTYYIRYTFTNPTDVAIEKDILYTEVGLYAYWNDTSSKITKNVFKKKINALAEEFSAKAHIAKLSSSEPCVCKLHIFREDLFQLYQRADLRYPDMLSEA